MLALLLLQNVAAQQQPAPPLSWQALAGAGLALLAFVIGGGTIGRWLGKYIRDGYVANIKHTLEGTFAKKADLDGLRTALESALEDHMREIDYRVREAENVASAAMNVGQQGADSAKQSLEAARRIEHVQQQFQQRLVDDVLVPIRAMAEKQSEHSEILSAQVALLKRLTEQVDRKL